MSAKGRKRTPIVPDRGQLLTAADRVNWLLENNWHGNRSEMARAVGCTHSVLTKIAAGQQQPGRRLLTAIAAHPKVNPGWLVSGEGEPLLSERPDGSSNGWPVPITQKLFRGSPDQNRGLLTGESFPTAGAFYRPSRYWLEIQPAEPILGSAQRIRHRDLLLMESDPTWWADEAMLDNRLCVVAVPQGKVANLKLGLAVYYPGDFEEPSGLTVDLFPNRHPERAKPGAKEKAKPFRQIHLVPKQLLLENVQAVCLMVTRRF